MTLNDLQYGDTFTLNRSGEKYTKLNKYYYHGKRTRRFNVFDFKKLSFGTLSNQCEVIQEAHP